MIIKIKCLNKENKRIYTSVFNEFIKYYNTYKEADVKINYYYEYDKDYEYSVSFNDHIFYLNENEIKFKNPEDKARLIREFNIQEVIE
jgi:uncharacterized protein with ParB-like and HNH nuclease domain